MTPALSVVVIGRNEGPRLSRCLASLDPLRRARSVEVIYVDSCSTDDSLARAAVAGATLIPLTPSRPSAALARNAGWCAAAAPLVLFLDGDTELDAGFVPAALAHFADPAIAVVWGHRRESRPEASVYNRVLDLDWIYRPGLSDFCGGDAIMRRSALEAVGGFDEGLIAGEEPDLCRRLRARGLAILHIDQPMTRHDLAISRFSQYWRRAERAGHAYAEVSSRFRGTADPLWRRDALHNAVVASGLIAVPCLTLAAIVLFRSAWPIAAVAACALLITGRAAVRARWKGGSATTLLLYALHSYFQQIPIFAGQLAFHRLRRRGRSRGLIDYKAGAA